MVAGAAGFGLALYLCRDAFRADLARLKETLPEDDVTADEHPPVATPPLPAPTAATLAIPAAER
jgi:hypothetical protein